MKRLIVTADDFGFTRSVSEGIAKARREGIVTSINVLPTGSAFGEGLSLLRELKLEEIGAHLALTGTAPVTYPGSIPSLIGKNGRFRKNFASFFADLFLGRVKESEIRLELENQLERLKRTGIPITNLTSHEHIHMMPAILRIFTALAKERSIPFIRYPRRDLFVRPIRISKLLKVCLLPVFEKKMGAIIAESGLRSTDHFFGFLDAGNMSEGLLLEMLNRLEDGVTEIVCHPGFLSPELLDRCIFQLNCEGELAALTSVRVKRFIQDNGIRLTGYREIIAEGKR